MKIELINKAKLKPDKGQPRKTFDLTELKESIKESGVLVPLIVTPSNMILDGERRWRASKEVSSIKELPCVVVEKKEYEKPDKRLELQLITNEMSEKYNVVEKAEAYQRYLDAGHTVSQLSRLLRKSPTTIDYILSLLPMRLGILEKLRRDDTDWSFHADIESILNGDVPQKQKDRIHERVIEGAFDNRDQLRETLAFAKEHPVQAEKVINAKTSSERGLAMLEAEPVSGKEYKPKKKTTKEDIELQRFTEMIQALNAINSARYLWAMSDAVTLVKKLATKEQRESIKKSVGTIVKVWTDTLNKLN